MAKAEGTAASVVADTGSSATLPSSSREPDAGLADSLGPRRVRRILTIDGGGIRGAFPAGFLSELERDLEHPIARYFDLIAGTSTGGIIAIGLALGIPAADLKALYENEGPEIFGQAELGLLGLLGRGRRLAHWLWRPKYNTDRLGSAVRRAFGDRTLGEATARLVIPSWHAETQHAYIFKTAHHARFDTDYKRPAVDAALATAAPAPYFPAHVTSDGVTLVDGGFWANNPVAVAVVEAIGTLGWSAADLRVLSLGCLDEIGVVEKRYGLCQVLPALSAFFLRSQSSGSLGIARTLTGDPHQRNAIFRVSQPAPEKRFSLDDTRRIRDLIDRAVTEARRQKPLIKPKFFREPAEEFRPFHGRPE